MHPIPLPPAGPPLPCRHRTRTVRDITFERGLLARAAPQAAQILGNRFTGCKWGLYFPITLDVQALPPGIYVYVLEIDGRPVANHKLLIQ